MPYVLPVFITCRTGVLRLPAAPRASLFLYVSTRPPPILFGSDDLGLKPSEVINPDKSHRRRG